MSINTVRFYKTKIYIIFLNCKTLMEYLVDALSNMLYYEDNDIYIENIENRENNYIENKKNNMIFIFGEKSVYNIKLIKEKIDDVQFFCYRDNFPFPLKNNLTSDAGWGCMARTGQMMLCQALKNILINKSREEIVSYFFDIPQSPFSIHNITESGAKHHIPVGKWFNPTGIGYTIKDLVSKTPETNNILQVVMSKDGCVYEKEILDILQNNINKKNVLVLIPVMLGIDKINESCCQSLLKCFETKFSLGIVGGKPRQSFYFIGKSDNNVFFLDPHVVKPAMLSFDSQQNNKDYDEVIRYMDVSDLDPCMLVCFLIKSEDEFYEWKKYINYNVNNDSDFSIFSVYENEENIKDDMYFDSENNLNKNTEKDDGGWVTV
jgi:hypothetical protein